MNSIKIEAEVSIEQLNEIPVQDLIDSHGTLNECIRVLIKSAVQNKDTEALAIYDKLRGRSNG